MQAPPLAKNHAQIVLILVLLAFRQTLLAQSIQLGSVSVSNSAVQFQVQAPSNSYIRVDSSPDLVNWLPVDLYLSGVGPHTTIDSFAQTNRAQFYQALEVDPGVGIIDFFPGTATAGGQIEIYGQFLPPLGQYTVQINGTDAPIISSTSTRFVVTVPANAATGLITVTAAGGSINSSDALVVLSNAVVRFQPPNGIATANFVIANNYGTGVLISNTAADYSIPVREGFPTLSFASVPGHESSLFFCAVSFDAGQIVDMSASSTAAALVFQDWNLFTTDPALSPSLMAIIQSNSAVQTFGQVLATAMVQDQTPYEDPAVTNAYQAAVISVLTNASFANFAESVVPLAKPPSIVSGGPRQDDLNSQNFIVYDVLNPELDTSILWSAAGIKGNGRYLEVTSKGLNFKMSATDYLFNPVDWIVAYQSVDVDASFPAGRPAFEKVWREIEYNPQAYVTNGAFFAQRSVSADPFSSRIDVAGYAVKAFLSLFTPKVDTSVSIPPGDGIYVIRAVGPAILTPQDFSFVRNSLPDEYTETLAVNLGNTVFKLFSLMTDDKTTQTVLKSMDEYNGLVVSVIQQGPIRSVDDFKRAALTILQSVVKSFLKDNVKDAAAAVAKVVAENVVPIPSLPKQLKKISAIGALAERAVGLVNSTSLETSFIVVGDPFSLKNVTVVPAAAAPGQTVTVTFRGGKTLKAFDTDTDSVVFEGPSVFNGVVESVSGPDGVGNQTLTVTIPQTINPNTQGAYIMYVLTQGRKGNASFTLALGAALTSVTPLQGFVPAASFNGQPFPGTAVRFQGALFTAGDTFLFSGGTNGMTATNVHANASSGDVTVYVPAGATTGLTQILHPTTGGTLTIPGPGFTVLGPPVIMSVDPPGGAPVGSILHVKVSQSGNDPTVILAQFTGSIPQNAIVRPDGALMVTVTVGAQSGFLTVTTPAGSNQVPYNVFPGATSATANGAVIRVGGTSSITLAQAIGFAMGTLTPTLAQASNGISTYIQNPPNYGAPWKVGPPYTNTISGTSIDDATIPITVFMEGTYSGNFVFSADNNYAGGTYGTVSILGNNNSFGDTFNGPVTISGNGNQLYGTLNGPVTISGNNNTLGQSTVYAPMVVSGDENTLNDFTTFKFVAGNALTITGDYNSVGNFSSTWVTSGVLGANFQTNSGDGVVIDGGMFNLIAINQSVGNGGNGVTLTGGAEGNLLGVGTGGYSNQYFGVSGTGNLGHGVALIGSATANTINGRSSGLSGNGLDGLYMDGAGVTLNSYNGTCTFNGRNGVTMTNGASLNSIGYISPTGFNSTSVVCDYNAASGVVCVNCGPNQVDVLAQKNGLYGVLLSGVKAPPGSFALAVVTQASGGIGSPLYVSGNGAAGLRLENGTTGIQMVPAASSLANDHNGLELDGAGVSTNVLNCTVSGAIGDGALITGGAQSNNITLGAIRSSADGILIEGASNNLVYVNTSPGIISNADNGIHISGASSGNHITGGSGAGTMRNVLNGCLIDAGSSNNAIDSLDFYHNVQDGLTFSGMGVIGNTLSHSFVLGNGRDGIRFEMGASENAVGAVPSPTNFFPNDININGGDIEAAIMITDPETSNNVVQNCSIYGESVAVMAKNQANIGQITQSYFSQNTNGVILQDGAHDGVLSGLAIQNCYSIGLVVQDACNVLIGGQDPIDINQFSGNPTGIDMNGDMASNNVIENNQISGSFFTPGSDGVFIHDGASQNTILGANVMTYYLCGVRIEAAWSNVVSQAAIEYNSEAGIIVAEAASDNFIEGNNIQYNGVGVLVSDEGSIGNTITGNSITYNAGKGIQLSAGGNTQIAPPTLPPYSGLTVYGSSTAPDGSLVEIFWDPGDQGQTYVGGGVVLSGHFSVVLDVDPKTLGSTNLNATVTDPDGNTSEFSGQSQEILPLPHLVFTAVAPSGHRQIYLSANGAKPVSLTENWNPGSDDFSPAAPGGVSCAKLLFVSLHTGNEDIFAMDENTNAQPQQVTTDPAADYDPAWLVPCQRLVFVSDRSANPQIYAINLDGGNFQRLTTNSFADTSPSPFLDGKQIVFISNRSGTNSLWIMNADGSSQMPLSGVTGASSDPAISPDGRTVAMAITQNSASEIAIVGINGSGFVQLTHDGAHAGHPTWLADGQNLIFSSDRSGPTNLYSINIAGTSLQPLILNPDTGSEPSAGGE